MIVLHIDDKKDFMKKLLIDDSFNDFELIQGSITTYNVISIDGKINPDFYGTDYDSSDVYGLEFTPWNKAKELALNIIKGKYTPVAFKFVLRVNDNMTNVILADISPTIRDQITSLVINIRFDASELNIVTGISQKNFSLDKTIDEAWDSWVSSFIQGMQ